MAAARLSGMVASFIVLMIMSFYTKMTTATCVISLASSFKCIICIFTLSVYNVTGKLAFEGSSCLDTDLCTQCQLRRYDIGERRLTVALLVLVTILRAHISRGNAG